MENVEVLKIGVFGIASAPCLKNNEFIAWGKVGNIAGDCPIKEPGDVWFNFGATREIAVEKTLMELRGA